MISNDPQMYPLKFHQLSEVTKNTETCIANITNRNLETQTLTFKYCMYLGFVNGSRTKMSKM